MDFGCKVRIVMGAGRVAVPGETLRARLAMCGSSGRASLRRREPTEPKRFDPFHEPRTAKSAAPKKGSAQSKTASRRKVTSPCCQRQERRDCLLKADESPPPKRRGRLITRAERMTEAGRRATLLSQPEGASIEEMTQATDWQQHSVRGFLADTVKKKLGFSLTSLKPNDGARRYRIETPRAR